MQANDSSFSTVIGHFQYQIPYFQRSYVWKQEQISKFIEDMIYVSDEYTRYNQLAQNFEYFMGTIISKAVSSRSGYQVLDLVDGQQRITTFAVFFKAMSLVYNNTEIFDNVFKFSYGLTNPQKILKLVSSHVDQPIVDKILNNQFNVALDKEGDPIPSIKKWTKRGMHPLYVAYNIFRDKLEELKAQDKYILPDNIINGVKFINMSLSGNDDAQVYFDNINSLGVRLTTSAIIKNYIFTHNAAGYTSYKSQWEPVFEGPNSKYWYGEGNRSHLDEFLFYYLQSKTYDQNLDVQTTDKALYCRRDAVANHIKDLCERYMNNNKGQLLTDIIKYADTYSKIALENIGDNANLGQKDTIEKKLARLGYLIKKLKTSTIIPYLLFLVNKNTHNSQDTASVLEYLESYLIRRSMTEMSADNYNKFFKEILIGKDVLTLVDLKNELSSKNNRSTDMPTDQQIMSSLTTLDYNGDNETPKALLYMYELELCRINKSQTKPLSPDSYTLEHIMPQTLDRAFWPGPNQSEDHIYKIGNMGLLTQSLQSILKNRGWNDKLNGCNGNPGLNNCCKGLLIMANVISQTDWNDAIIDNRTNRIVSDILSIWKE